MSTPEEMTREELIAEAREAERLRREVAALADDLDRGDSIDRGIAADLRALIGGER